MFDEHRRKPLVIGQGANDPRVKQAEADQIFTAMRKKNLDVKYYLYPDEGHGFARPSNRYAWSRTMSNGRYSAVEAMPWLQITALSSVCCIYRRM